MSLFKEESNQIITSPNSNEIGFDLHDKLLEELENINTSANFEREYDEIFEIRNHCLQNSLNQINFEEFLINVKKFIYILYSIFFISILFFRPIMREI